MTYNEPPVNPCRRLALLILLTLLLSVGHASAAGSKDKILYSFQGGDDGAAPKGGLIVDRVGNLYGTTYSGGSLNFKGTVFQLVPPSAPGSPWTENVLYDFPDLSVGQNPWSGLTSDAAGNLYGTTWLGGSGADGVVFELSPPVNAGDPWTYTVLYNFTGGADGGQPQAGMVFDKAGNLYGTTEIGGAPVCMGGCGVVYKLTPPGQQGGAWTETPLYGFSNVEGGTTAGVIVDSKGAVYGTTVAGGNGPCFQGCGTIFQLVPPPQPGGKWTHRVLYNFQGGSDGIQPEAALILDSKHNLYGSTITDGTGTCFLGTGPGCGTIFELSPPIAPGAPWTETILYKFLGGNDGIEPTGALVFDKTGNLYGTTEIGGTGTACLGGGCGTVFKLAPPAQVGGVWTESVLYRFTGGNDGFLPLGVTFGRGGALYGTSNAGDTSPACFGVGCGTVFSVLP
jgi:uncharacterized repeat protein (TIGR03803 family)